MVAHKRSASENYCFESYTFTHRMGPMVDTWKTLSETKLKHITCLCVLEVYGTPTRAFMDQTWTEVIATAYGVLFSINTYLIWSP